MLRCKTAKANVEIYFFYYYYFFKRGLRMLSVFNFFFLLHVLVSFRHKILMYFF